MFSLKSFCQISALALITATSAQAEDVNIYSYRQPDLLKPLTDAFTAETGINVNVAYIDKGLIERMKAEGRRSPADVVLTVDIALLAAIVDADLTQAVASDTLAKNVPAQYRDPDNHWFGLSNRARIAYASKERVADGELTTYEDLVDPKWRGRICTRSGKHDYNIALTAAMIAHSGEAAAKEWLAGIKENLARKPQGNDRAQVKAIWAGECDIAIGNTYYMGQMLSDPEQKDWAESVRIIFPEFDGHGSHVNISGVALAKHAPNPEAALKLMEFLTSPTAQEIYARANFEYPIAEGTKPSDLVASWGSFRADEINLMEVAKHRAAALRITEEVDFDNK
ncbi:Fe(3+) ABC transporter substrate-binding protein [Rhodobacteraceae bacterium]|jgi:iron(III) transport system substrate-binding protein|nr:Fe(3+) ABC transporter substrate-binding protein [Paracoccaceae bacterium]